MVRVPIIAFVTSKGGAGKTTSCILVGGKIAARGERILILDTEAQNEMARDLSLREKARWTQSKCSRWITA